MNFNIKMSSDSPLDIDVTHLLPSEECVVLEHHLVSVPDDDPQLPGARFPGTDVNLYTKLL